MYPILAKTLQRGTISYTDLAPCYMRLQKINDADGVSTQFRGEAVNHSQVQYARTGIDGTRVSSNKAENANANLKAFLRTHKGFPLSTIFLALDDMCIIKTRVGRDLLLISMPLWKTFCIFRFRD